MRTLLLFAVLGLSAAKPPPSSLQRDTLEPVPFEGAEMPPSGVQKDNLELVPFEGAEMPTLLACGAHQLSAGTYTIQSANHPNNYDNYIDCSYTLTPASGVSSLSLSCSAFNLESHSTCAYDWLSVDEEKFCSTNAPSKTVNGAAMQIDFHTDYSVVKSGFLCTIEAVEEPLACGSHTLEVGVYTIKSPNYPENYGNEFDCDYTFTAGAGVGDLELSCRDFDIESHSSCDWDWLKVGSQKYCGTSAPVATANGTLSVSFHTDYSVVRRGFWCEIEAKPGTAVTTTTGAPGTCTCGVANRATRVVGGVETEVGEYPWQAGLVSPGGTRTWCGGSLINDRYVVTAAHCTAGSTPSNIQVLLGEHRINVADGETRHIVSQIIDHPSYINSTTGYDISLLKLSAPVTFSSRVATVCLPTAGQTYAGASAIATGFGRTGAEAPQATELQEVTVPVWSQYDCSRVWGTTLKSSMICAGGRPEGGESVCMGDSGGPLVTLENGKYALIGAVSFGRPCAKAGVPDVYARVTEVLPWIQSNTADATYCS